MILLYDYCAFKFICMFVYTIYAFNVVYCVLLLNDHNKNNNNNNETIMDLGLVTCSCHRIIVQKSLQRMSLVSPTPWLISEDNLLNSIPVHSPYILDTVVSLLWPHQE